MNPIIPPEVVTAVTSVVYFFLIAPAVITLGVIISPDARYLVAIWLLRSYRLRRATDEYAKVYAAGLSGDDLLLVQPENHPLAVQRFAAQQEAGDLFPSGERN